MAGIGQNGLAHSKEPFDRERYEAVQRIAAEILEILAEHSNVSVSQAVEILAGETGHATQKVDLRGVVLKDDEDLLVKIGSGLISVFDEDSGVGRAFRLYEEEILDFLQCESVQSEVDPISWTGLVCRRSAIMGHF